MADNQNRVEYLESALAAVQALEAEKQQYEEQQRLYKENAQEYEALLRKMEREQDALVKERRREIEQQFDKQLRGAQSNLTEAQEKRDKARQAGVEDRIKAETASLKTANQGQRDSIASTLKQTGLPAICGSKGFLALFAPRGIGEVALLFLVAILCLVIIPLIVVSFVNELIWKIVLFVVIDLAFLGLYALIYAKTVKNNLETFNACHDIMDLIKVNEKKIREITRQIRRDKSDDPYDLSANDSEIAQLTLAKNEIVNNRQQALTAFDTQTADQLRLEVNQKYAEDLTAKKAAADQCGAAAKNLNDQIIADEMKLNETYSQYIGIRKMNAESLTEMIEEEKNLQQEREAAAVAAAAAAEEEARKAQEAAAAAEAEAAAAQSAATETADEAAPAENAAPIEAMAEETVPAEEEESKEETV